MNSQAIHRGRARQGFILGILALLFISTVCSTAAHAQLNPGDVLVVDAGAATGLGALFQVDPSTGQRRLISDFADPDQGALGIDPIEAAIGNSGNILVIDGGGGQLPGGKLFSVDPTTGQRTVISDFRDSNQGPLGFGISDVAIGSSDTILVIDADGGRRESTPEERY